MSHWICVCVSPRFLVLNGTDDLGSLFEEVFREDYIEHHLFDTEHNDDSFNETGCYVFVHCHDYMSHVDNMYTNHNIRNVLNSYADIKEMHEDEVFSTRKTPTKVIAREDFKVNRSDFFMFGDVVKVTTGNMSKLQGIVINKRPDSENRYEIMFRLFTRAFSTRLHSSQLEFVTSFFKHIKVPVSRRKIIDSKKNIVENIQQYNTHVSRVRHEMFINRQASQLKSLRKTRVKTDIVKTLMRHEHFDVVSVLKAHR